MSFTDLHVLFTKWKHKGKQQLTIWFIYELVNELVRVSKRSGKSICKVLDIEQPIERRQKPELLNKGQHCYLCLEEINGQPDYKANKDKLNNKVKTVCISCKNTTCIKHFITTCDRCFEGSDEWFYFLVFLQVVYSEKKSNCLWKSLTN